MRHCGGLVALQKLCCGFLSSFYYQGWKGVLAISLRPYYLGVHFSALAH